MGLKQHLQSFDDRRDIIIPGTQAETIAFSAELFVALATKAIASKGAFNVALSGGSTPAAIYKRLASNYKGTLDWSKVFLFWSDERCVPPNHPESNYLMAMQSGLDQLSIPAENIFRMPADAENLEDASKQYEQTILKHVPKHAFDLVMLGMGEDGHTASLFPKTHGLQVSEDRLVIANFVPQKNTWRMSLTFKCINSANQITVYVLGANKAEMVKKVLTATHHPETYPIQAIGTRLHKALWILDKDAAKLLSQNGS